MLLHPEVARSGKSPMFLSLLFKAMKGDVSTKRVAAFAKRLLQVAQEQQPAFTCGCLLMLSEILKVKKEKTRRERVQGLGLHISEYKQ